MKSPVARLALAAALACSAVATLAQTVTPPPLPPGSHLVRPEAGLNEEEKKRYVRAHHHKMHHKKDYTKDDSLHGHEHGAPAARPVGTRATGAAAGVQSPSARPGNAGVPGGNGTGPAREKTDRGASSWFFGNDGRNSNSKK